MWIYFRDYIAWFDIDCLGEIAEAVNKARSKHPKFTNSPEQIVCIATEELGEMAQAINDKKLDKAKLEALDLIAVLIRFVEEDK